MPATAHDIISEQEHVITVNRNTPIKDALGIMVVNDFSTLPVIDEVGKPDGLISGDSILKGVSNFGIGLDELVAHDVAERAVTYYSDDNIFDILNGMRDNPAVLIIDSEGKLTNIITAYDVAEYFRKRAENMMLVEDIETAVKDHIEAAYIDMAGNIDNKLKEVIKAATKRNRAFEKLTFGQYIRILVHEETWQRYGHNFAMSSNGLFNMLERVQDTRNKLAHFDPTFTPAEHENLKFAANWFERNPVVTPEPELTIIEQPEDDSVSPVDEELDPNESRYAKLGNYLRGITEPRIKLLFEKIEEVIASRLPQSARVHRAWWANDTVSHTQSREWLDAGWRVGSVNLTAGHVTFVRIKEREEMYIKFFSKLLDKLRDTDFVLRDASPMGTNWVKVQAVNTASFNFSFTRSKKLRVELYIDTGNQAQNKEIFDNLYAQREQIESEIGEPLSWERLSSKRASRIAIYRDGTITDDAQTLDALQGWAIPMMIRFEKALSKRIQ